jgi:hypothetical protein
MARGGDHQAALAGPQSVRQKFTGDVDQLGVGRVEVDNVTAVEVVVDEQESPPGGCVTPTVPVRVFGKPVTIGSCQATVVRTTIFRRKRGARSVSEP